MTRPRRNSVSMVALILISALINGCGNSAADPGTTAGGESDQPSDGVVSWIDPTQVVDAGNGWQVAACEGAAALLCVSRDGDTVGTVEALGFSLSSFDTLDPSLSSDENLTRFAGGFVEALSADRAAGCGQDYAFEVIDTESAVVASLPGVTFGYRGTLPDGAPSELNIQYAAINDDTIISIVAAAYDGGGCPGRDDVSGFTSSDLEAFLPLLGPIIANAPLPPVDG